jgi:tetratricopeptide (TPR) repeat protein
MALMGNFEEGASLCEKGLNFALKINNLYSVGWSEFVFGWLFISQGKGEIAVEYYEKSIRRIEQAQLLLLLGLAWSGLGWGYYLLGDLRKALNHVQKGLQIQRDAGFGVVWSLYHYYSSMIHVDLEDLQSAQAVLKNP